MRFRVLDSWRGIAAVCVVLFHFEAANDIHALRFVQHSFLFVDFFFVLSGFVIAHAYGDRLTSPANTTQFVIRRFGRVWPLHIAVLAAFVTIELLKYALISHAHVAATTGAFDPDGSTPLSSLPQQVLLLQGIGVTDKLTWNTPSWSISAEFWTYLLFALIITLPSRFRTAAFAISAALGAAIVMAYSHHGMDATYDLGLPRCIFGFSLGCLVYWVRSRANSQSRSAGTISEVTAVIAIIAFVTITNRSPLSYAAPLLFAVVVYIFSFEAGLVSRWLTRPVFQSLGRWSYSIYMVQALIAFIIGLAVSELQRRLGVDLWKPIVEDGISKRVIISDHVILLDVLHLVYVAVVVALAAITYRIIEQPGRRYFNRFANGWTTPRRAQLVPVAAHPSSCQSQESR
ncbi:MAG TPA: acyltransferase [Hyphomicrobium sp.]